MSKTFRPTPLSHSLGLDGIYRLELRGEDKKVRRQMGTREVFLAYEVGDQFDDHATAGAVKAGLNCSRGRGEGRGRVGAAEISFVSRCPEGLTRAQELPGE